MTVFWFAETARPAPTNVALESPTTSSFDVTYDTPPSGRDLIIEFKKSGTNWQDATTQTVTADASPFTVSIDPSALDPDADPQGNADTDYNVRVKTVGPGGDSSFYTSIMNITSGNENCDDDDDDDDDDDVNTSDIVVLNSIEAASDAQKDLRQLRIGLI